MVDNGIEFLGSDLWFLCKPDYLVLIMSLFKNDMIECLLNPLNIIYYCENNRVDLLKIVYTNTDHFQDITEIFDKAASINLDMVKYLNSAGASCTSKAMDNAASNGKIQIVKWLHRNRSEGCTTAAMDCAALNGHFQVI